MTAQEVIPEGFHRVRGLAWPDLELMSSVLRRIGHDVNNAVAPALGLLDMMRVRHSASLAGPDIDRLGQRMKELSLVSGRTVRQSLRAQHREEPTMSSIRADLASTAVDSQVTLRWQVTPDSSSASLPDLGGHQASLMLRCLISNALQAHASEPRPPDRGPPFIAVAIQVRSAGDVAELRVDDDGPGCVDLPGAASAALCRHGPGHLGIGLLTASTLVGRGGGSLYIGPRPGGGFSALAVWPPAGVRARA